ncbi:MAG TPA: GDP-mannose 4,6-dehydratase [bacterium]|nr:GDP-mannose 4,6-dehydratase [bacterium]
MKVLVTGGAGFIGSHLADALLASGHQVRIFDVLDPQVHPDGNKPKYLSKDVEFVKGDIRDIDALRRGLKGQDAVFHYAAAVGVAQSQYKIKHYVDVNIGGTANLLDLLVNEKTAVKKVIVAVSQTGYGEGCYHCPTHGTVRSWTRSEEQLAKGIWEHLCPECGAELSPIPTPETAALKCSTIYAQTKRQQEDMVLAIGMTYNIPSVALRFFNVFGPRQSLSNPYTGVMAIFLSRLANGKPPVIYEDGLQTRDFVSVHDVVQAGMLALEKPAANFQAYNVGSGKPTTILEVAQILARLTSNPIEPEVLHKYRKGDTRHCTADITKIRTELGYEPKVTFEEGLREIIAWAKDTTPEDKFEQAAKELAERGLV